MSHEYVLTDLQQSAHALTALMVSADCSSGISSSSCNLRGFLHVLYVVAGALAIVLIAVITFAVHAWRRTKEADLTRP